MRTTRISRLSRLSPRLGPAAAVVVAVSAPLALAAAPAWAGPGISVTTNGSMVQVRTTSCPSGGKAALLGNGSSSFAQGRQTELTGGNGALSASWQGIGPGTYTVAVICAGGGSAGSQRITVTGAAPSTATPTPTPSPSVPTGKVRAGFGGGARLGPGPDPSVQIAGGAALAVTAAVGGTWLIRRRSAQRGAGL